MFGAKDCTGAGVVILDLKGDTYMGWQSMPSAIPWSSAVANKNSIIMVKVTIWVWWITPVIPGLGMWRQEDSHELEANIGYIVSFRTA